MLQSKRIAVVFSLVVFGLGFVAGHLAQIDSVVEAQSNPIFELRTYTTHPGRLDALNARFRDHTMRIFEKHGMTNVGYWTPQDAPLSENTLIYVLLNLRALHRVRRKKADRQSK